MIGSGQPSTLCWGSLDWQAKIKDKDSLTWGYDTIFNMSMWLVLNRALHTLIHMPYIQYIVMRKSELSSLDSRSQKCLTPMFSKFLLIILIDMICLQCVWMTEYRSLHFNAQMYNCFRLRLPLILYLYVYVVCEYIE